MTLSRIDLDNRWGICVCAVNLLPWLVACLLSLSIQLCLFVNARRAVCAWLSGAFCVS